MPHLHRRSVQPARLIHGTAHLSSVGLIYVQAVHYTIYVSHLHLRTIIVHLHSYKTLRLLREQIKILTV